MVKRIFRTKIFVRKKISKTILFKKRFYPENFGKKDLVKKKKHSFSKKQKIF